MNNHTYLSFKFIVYIMARNSSPSNETAKKLKQLNNTMKEHH